MAYRIKSPVERRMSVMCQRQGGQPQMRGVAYGHDVVGPVLVRLLSPYSWNMISNKIKPKANLRLRKVGKQYMIVESCADNVNMSNVFSLNKTAARLWERIEQADVTTAELVDWLCSVYDVDAVTAYRDVERQLSEWRSFGLLE